MPKRFYLLIWLLASAVWIAGVGYWTYAESSADLRQLRFAWIRENAGRVDPYTICQLSALMAAGTGKRFNFSECEELKPQYESNQANRPVERRPTFWDALKPRLPWTVALVLLPPVAPWFVRYLQRRMRG